DQEDRGERAQVGGMRDHVGDVAPHRPHLRWRAGEDTRGRAAREACVGAHGVGADHEGRNVVVHESMTSTTRFAILGPRRNTTPGLLRATRPAVRVVLDHHAGTTGLPLHVAFVTSAPDIVARTPAARDAQRPGTPDACAEPDEANTPLDSTYSGRSSRP